MLPIITLVCLLSTLAASQFVIEPKGLKNVTGYAGINVRYKEVPTGICELDPTVKSFSGYADVAENQHIFWWFFESRTVHPKQAPLAVWINGGPGSSSMIGLFQELGPCGIDSKGHVVNNPYSWSNITNLLFIDQPTQTGFSYSNPIPGYLDPSSGDIVPLPNATCPDSAEVSGTCGTYSYPDKSLTANSTAAAVPNIWKTLQGFMGAFPKYSRHGFHFTSESYGGHYAPVFNEYLEQQNANLTQGAKKINLESVLIGNGWYDPLVQYPAYYNFTVDPGNTYDYRPFNSSIESQMYSATYGSGNCVDRIKNCSASGQNGICNDADSFCYENVEYLLDTYAGRDEYDIREVAPDPFPYEYYVNYLNQPKVQAAIGAFQNYTESSNTVSSAFATTGDDAREDGTVMDLRKLLSQDVQVVMYFGDADYICNWIGGKAVAEKVGAPGYSEAGFTKIISADGVEHGEVRQSGIFSFVRIYEAGHEVPFYQPLVSFEMFERVVNRRDIATGTKHLTSTYKTSGPIESSYREGNSTVQFEVLSANSTYNTTLNGPNLSPPLISKQKARLPTPINRNRYSRRKPRRTRKSFEL